MPHLWMTVIGQLYEWCLTEQLQIEKVVLPGQRTGGVDSASPEPLRLYRLPLGLCLLLFAADGLRTVVQSGGEQHQPHLADLVMSLLQIWSELDLKSPFDIEQLCHIYLQSLNLQARRLSEKWAWETNWAQVLV